MRTCVLYFLVVWCFGFGVVGPEDARLAEAVGTGGGMTRAEWKTPKVELRRQILVAAGLVPLPAKRAVPRARYYGKQTFDGFTVEKVLIETSPGYWLGGNLFRHLAGGGKRPANVGPHGHWKNGRAEQTELGNIPARGAMLARMASDDMAGYCDTKQTPHAFADPLWNWGPLGLQL